MSGRYLLLEDGVSDLLPICAACVEGDHDFELLPGDRFALTQVPAVGTICENCGSDAGVEAWEARELYEEKHR